VAGRRQLPVTRASSTPGKVRSTTRCGLEDSFADPFWFGVIFRCRVSVAPSLLEIMGARMGNEYHIDGLRKGIEPER
jgi:hypothetical protein